MYHFLNFHTDGDNDTTCKMANDQSELNIPLKNMGPKELFLIILYK